MTPSQFNEPCFERKCFTIEVEVLWNDTIAVINGETMSLEDGLGYLATLPQGLSS